MNDCKLLIHVGSLEKLLWVVINKTLVWTSPTALTVVKVSQKNKMHHESLNSSSPRESHWRFCSACRTQKIMQRIDSHKVATFLVLKCLRVVNLCISQVKIIFSYYISLSLYHGIRHLSSRVFKFYTIFVKMMMVFWRLMLFANSIL